MTLRFRGVFISALASTLLVSHAAAPAIYAQTQAGSSLRPQQAAIASLELGVVQSPENASYWQQILERLHATGVTYRVINWRQVTQASDLNGFNTIFLPNVEAISPEQMAALQTWANQGGRLVVSGAVGHRSPQRVKRQLRSLLGAYWTFPLSQPSVLQPIEPASRGWAVSGQVGSAVDGGVVIPVGEGQTSGVWQNPAGSASSALSYGGSSAVVVTDQTTFLGWVWGNANSTFDSSWLSAALARFQGAPQQASRPAPSAAVRLPATPTVVMPPMPQVPTPAPVSSTPAPPARSAASAPPVPRTTASPNPVAVRPTITIPRPAQSQDPAEQVAPAGVPVELSDLPITGLEAIAMRQELQNLIGRFESALLSANSSVELDEVQTSSLIDSAQDTSILVAAKDTLPIDTSMGLSHATGIASQARELLASFSQLVSQQDYRTARRQWLEARQLLWDNFPTERSLTQPEIRAMWLDRGTIVDARSRQGLTELFDRLAAAGINTVFFETVNAGYPIYPSEVAPTQNPLTWGWDPLKDAVELAHERNMELHAWVWVFAVGNSRHNTIVNLPGGYPGPVLSAHPDWAGYDNRGRVVPPGQTKPFLDPANPAARSYLLRLFQEIVTHYDVDGLQLDYIRYPFQDPSAGRSYGYGTAARQQFQALTGVDPNTITPSDRQLWERWTEFRTQQVDSFVAQVSQQLRRINPDLILSAAVFAMSEHERVQKIQQNWEVWVERGDVDVIVPMSYAMDTNRLQRLVTPFLSDARLDTSLIVPSIRLLDLPEPAALDQIQALRDMPSGGYSLFAVANLSESLESVFSRTQGQPVEPDGSAEPIPYRQPFHAAAYRFEALQREWRFLLDSQQLWISERQLTEFNTHAAELDAALTALAEEPTAQHLRDARSHLQQFREKFDDWMSLESLDGDYRIDTWRNRLNTLESFINYGERRLITRSTP